MKPLFTSLLLLCGLFANSQSASIKGSLQSTGGEAIPFANIALFTTNDSVLYKAGISNESGRFELKGIGAGNYFLKAIYLGYQDLYQRSIEVNESQELNLGVLIFSSQTVELAEATVTASRAMVEIKPDRTVFNVTGTINSTGSDGLSLLRKAPSVTVDNNDNISVLGRSGVLLYVDGKRLPLTGSDLSNYLQSLSADQIDRIEIITNPGAKYEAEGNAGIIDIRLKKDESQGGNGTLNSTISQGVYFRGNLSGSGNYRKKNFNLFGTGNIGTGEMFNRMRFHNELNNSVQEEINQHYNDRRNFDIRIGADYFINKFNTIGILASAGKFTNNNSSYNRIELASSNTPNIIDSILVADNTLDYERNQQSYNLNYRFDNTKGRSLNIDLDYGMYANRSNRYQPNYYFDPKEEVIYSQLINSFDTPTDIDIYTVTVDYEDKLWGGKLGFGSKLSKVVSDNTFLVYKENQGVFDLENQRSNIFKYDEMVYAGYVSYGRSLGENVEFSAGLRAEQTDAKGDLQTFLPELQEPPVELNYLNWFPTLGLSWKAAPKHMFALNSGRRINRPDYNVLNPFRNQISELSFEKGNAKLQPEIVNNVELGYTYAYRYNFKLGYSKTSNQITRLIAPDDVNPLAGFITWANLAEQTVLSFNASVPIQITKKWNAYFNASASHIDNQANYGEGAIVDVQAFTYSIYQQHTFNLPWNLTAEISGYYSGPGVWGGVFLYESNWSLDVGLQKKFLNNRLNVRISGSDLFYQTGWDGVSSFDGLVSTGSGRWDSRRASLSIGYRFGNDKVKSRKRKTGMEAEAGRVGG
ncbi:MAG: TonB-dependent receptor [Lewinellaceae bacterium]|nr:TonB-dependent receptor [Lewinellaceae bacterium]